MAKVVVVGSTNTDMTVRVPRLPAPGETVSGGDFRVTGGGKGANQAVAAARAGATVVFVTALGADDVGDRPSRAWPPKASTCAWSGASPTPRPGSR